MIPLNAHKTESDFYGDETLELKLTMSTYVHEGRLREHPSSSKTGIHEHLIFELEKLIEETDFSDIVVIEQKWEVPITFNGVLIGIATFNSREEIEAAFLQADCVLTPAIRGASDPKDASEVVELNIFPASMHAAHGREGRGDEDEESLVVKGKETSYNARRDGCTGRCFCI